MSKKRKAAKYVEPLNVKKEARLLPGYIILVLWVLFEVALLSWIVAASFSTTKEIFSNQMLQSGLHFENYIYSWTKGNMGKYFLNSLIYAGFGVSGALLLSAPCAYALSRFKFFYNKVLTNLLVLFLSIPQIMVVLPLYSIAVKYDLLNKHLTLLVLYICLNVPFCTFFLLNFFATLSHTFEEAAAVDGCTPIKTFFRIMLPLAQPGIITVGIFLFVNIWNEFFVAMIFATSSEVRPLAYGLYSLIQAMSTNGKWAELFASVMIVVVPTFILYLFLSEKIIAGVTGGGIKE